MALRVEATRGWRVLVYFFRDMKRGDSRETARTTFKNVLFCTRKFDSRLRQQREFALWDPPSPINPASYIHAASSGSTVRPAHSAQQRGATPCEHAQCNAWPERAAVGALEQLLRASQARGKPGGESILGVPIYPVNSACKYLLVPLIGV